jgi:hypothetical protein
MFTSISTSVEFGAPFCCFVVEREEREATVKAKQLFTVERKKWKVDAIWVSVKNAI